jgi:SAM-dependent methyltransferase
MTRSEFLKAIRALSARYVERRGTLPDRSPLDSAGKRAAFAGFYAPLHFLTARAIVSALGEEAGAPSTIHDLGCGTGVASAAWATSIATRPPVTGVDTSAWVLEQARETWRGLGLGGRGLRGDLVAELERLASGRPASPARSTKKDDARVGVVLGWSLNELDRAARERAEAALLALAARKARILVIEPVARRLVPWWEAFAERSVAAGARADEWRFTDPLPPVLADLDRDAGFDRDGLTARSLSW